MIPGSSHHPTPRGEDPDAGHDHRGLERLRAELAEIQLLLDALRERIEDAGGLDAGDPGDPRAGR